MLPNATLKRDSSWQSSAEAYAKLYQSLLEE
jgi:glycogen synthase